MSTNLLHIELCHPLRLRGNSLLDGSMQEAMLNRCHLKLELKAKSRMEHQQPNSVSLSLPLCPSFEEVKSNFLKAHIQLNIQHRPTKKRLLNQLIVLSKPIQSPDKKSESSNLILRIPSAYHYLQKSNNQRGRQSRQQTNRFAY